MRVVSLMLGYLVFAFVASITPGPANILALDCGARRGLLPAFIFAAGVAAGVALLIFGVGLGIGEALAHRPVVRRTLAWVGVVWLSYLSWRLFAAAPVSLRGDDAPCDRQPRLGLWTGIGLQLVNPKGWMMALTAVTVFAQPAPVSAPRSLFFAALFFVIAWPCVCVWAGIGRGAARWLGGGRALQWLCRVMAVVLCATGWLSLLW